MLRTCTKLQELALRNMRLADDTIDTIAQHQRHLTWLELSSAGSAITDRALAGMIEQCGGTQLRYLSLARTAAGSECVRAIGAAPLVALETLDLTYCKAMVDSSDIREYLCASARRHSLRRLNLFGARLSCEALAALLCDLGQLLKLEVSLHEREQLAVVRSALLSDDDASSCTSTSTSSNRSRESTSLRVLSLERCYPQVDGSVLEAEEAMRLQQELEERRGIRCWIADKRRDNDDNGNPASSSCNMTRAISTIE